MRLKSATFTVIALLAALAASSAAASCGRFPLTKLKDGTQACVVAVTTTEFTQTRSIDGGGPATARTSKSTGAAVVLRMLGEQTAKATTRNKIRQRAMSVCASYKNSFDGKVSRSAKPFMVVVIGWGDSPSKPLRSDRLSDTHREFYLTRNCRVTFEK